MLEKRKMMEMGSKLWNFFWSADHDLQTMDARDLTDGELHEFIEACESYKKDFEDLDTEYGEHMRYFVNRCLGTLYSEKNYRFYEMVEHT